MNSTNNSLQKFPKLSASEKSSVLDELKAYLADLKKGLKKQQPEPDEGSEAELDNQEEKADTTEVGDADSPFAQTGGTSHTDAAIPAYLGHGRIQADRGVEDRTDADTNPILTILDRADKHLAGLEDSAIERVNSALESAYQDLEAQILRRYRQEAPGSLMARDRALVLLSQVADLLTLLNTRSADDIQQAFEDLLRGADAQGVTLAQDLTRAIANQSLQMTANVPIEAIRNQATEGMTRLRNHTNAFADKASTIVTQGLIQGWGTDKVASLLQRELGVVRHKAETIARTESLSALDASTRATYQQNGVAYVQRIGTQDAKICPFCVARIGNVYPADKAPAVLHPRDRCYNAPFKFEWVELGLIDTAWLQTFKDGAISELAKQGLEPDPGIAPFEKANGLEAPVAVWEPGQREDGLEWDEWREDGNGVPCGKGWIRAGHKCSKGISSRHASANPNHPGHAGYQGALAATSGNHFHAAAKPDHPDHAAYKASFGSHGGKGEATGGSATVAPVSDALKAIKGRGPVERRAIAVTHMAINAVHTDGELPAIPTKIMPAEPGWGGSFVYDQNEQTGKITPDSIELAKKSGQPELDYAHEIGHFVDSQVLGDRGHYASIDHPALHEWRVAVAQSAAFRQLLGNRGKTTVRVWSNKQQQHVEIATDKAHVDYLLSTHELFARSYAQWIATKSRNPFMLETLAMYQGKRGITVVHPPHWQDDDFKPIGEALDRVFAKKGWLKQSISQR